MLLSRRMTLLGAPAALFLALPACSVFQPGGGVDIQSLYQQAIAAQKAAAVLFQAGGALVMAGVIKVPSDIHDAVDASFAGLGDTLDTVNAHAQAGETALQTYLAAGLAALAAAQAAIAKLTPTPHQSSRLMANRPRRGQSKFAVGAIIALVIQLLPIVIQVGGTIADLVRSLIASLSAPAGTLTLADVQAANNEMNAGLIAWTNAIPPA